MRRILAALIFFLPLLTGCFSFPGGIPRSGELQNTRILSFVSGTLSISGPYDIVLVPGNHVDAVMPQAILDSIVTVQTQQNDNIIAPERGLLLSGHGTVSLFVGVDALSQLNIKTTGLISSANNLAKSYLSLNLGGTVAGRLSLNVGTLNLVVTSPRSIVFSGNVDDLRLQAADLVHLDFRRLKMTNEPLIHSSGYSYVIKL